jgi:hypothetical protein
MSGAMETWVVDHGKLHPEAAYQRETALIAYGALKAVCGSNGNLTLVVKVLEERLWPKPIVVALHPEHPAREKVPF